MSPLSIVSFAGGGSGPWRIESVSGVVGDALEPAERLSVTVAPVGSVPGRAGDVWRLNGTTSNARYTHRSEAALLRQRQEGLDRPSATRAALIPIRKTAAWWGMAQDERRNVLEEKSRHIGIGLEYLPAVARRLHHCRELGESFDFLTWFEYAPEDEAGFDELLARLRATKEWLHVDREVDIRLSREDG